MRYKFRAWDGKAKKMYYQSNLVTFHFSGRDCWACWNKWGLPEEECVASSTMKEDCLEQFTGLTDKDGKEGYEADLLECGGAIWEVVWDNDSACWSVKSHTKTKCTIGTMFFSNIVTSGKVIGNVHENPELLEAE